ncbi:alpha/beta hydrolase [Phytohalomonas tamaricis]|uniref:alpha/beta hydrolase n=1 Tax=Phytohalomonas tamaricis TaxID=2081032 RepID=UPI000D0B7A40|nr:dienelactone hydrolase family protein [Phytohalomonas tamaricis]
MAFSQPQIIEPTNGQPADAAIIVLHGICARAQDFEPLIHALRLPRNLAARFVLPQASTLPITMHDGREMAAWYDVFDTTPKPWVDKIQLNASAAYIQALIEAEVAKGIDSKRIVVVGFDQGGVVAYNAALSCPQPLGGLMVLSGYFANDHGLEAHTANRELPIEVHHGLDDPAIPEALGREGANAVKALGYDVTYRSYVMGHGFCAEQLIQARHWMIQRLGAPTLVA